MPTPVFSFEILSGRAVACLNGTASHNPPQDMGLKYNPSNGGPADAELTGQIEKYANEYLQNPAAIQTMPLEEARQKGLVKSADVLTPYVTALGRIIDFKAIAKSGIKAAIHPLGGTSLPYYEAIKKRIENVEELQNVHILPFINNMPQYLVNMDLFVGRSGATFLAEVTALGVPCILIPSPYVTANHQEYNARSLTDHGGGVLLLEKELTGDRLYNEIDRIMRDDQLRLNMQNTSKQLGIPDAAQRLITLMNEIIEKK